MEPGRILLPTLGIAISLAGFTLRAAFSFGGPFRSDSSTHHSGFAGLDENRAASEMPPGRGVTILGIPVMIKIPITVAHGDGIGPEIMSATLRILEASGAALEIETIEIGEKVYLRGNSTGIEPSSWESLLRTKVFLKAPITTPQGGGFKSLNVTTRKTLGQYANVRPCVSYHPFIDTKHPNMDVVIVRENEED